MVEGGEQVILWILGLELLEMRKESESRVEKRQQRNKEKKREEEEEEEIGALSCRCLRG